MPVSLDWRQSPTPDDVVRAVSERFGQGTVVALPSEAGYVLAADPPTLTDPTRPAGLPDGLAVFRADGYFDATDFYRRYPDLPPADRVLVNRLWPGPVGYVHPDSPYPAWVPAHPALAAVLADRRDGLALFELPSGFDPVDLGDAVAVVVDDEPRPGPLTLLRSADGRWTMVRGGIRTADDIASSWPGGLCSSVRKHLPEPDGRGPVQGRAGRPSRLYGGRVTGAWIFGVVGRSFGLRW